MVGRSSYLFSSTVFPVSMSHRYDNIDLSSRRINSMVVVAASCISGLVLILLLLIVVFAVRHRKFTKNNSNAGEGAQRHKVALEALKSLNSSGSKNCLEKDCEDDEFDGKCRYANNGSTYNRKLISSWGCSTIVATTKLDHRPDEDVYERIALKKLEQYESELNGFSKTGSSDYKRVKNCYTLPSKQHASSQVGLDYR